MLWLNFFLKFPEIVIHLVSVEVPDILPVVPGLAFEWRVLTLNFVYPKKALDCVTIFLIEGVFDVRHVSVLDIDATPTHVITLDYIIFQIIIGVGVHVMSVFVLELDSSYFIHVASCG